MELNISIEIINDTAEACKIAFEKTMDTKYLAMYTYWLNMQSANKYRQETIQEAKKQ